MNPIEQIMALVDVMEPGNGRHRQALRSAIEQALSAKHRRMTNELRTLWVQTRRAWLDRLQGLLAPWRA